jgi:hypothetical protein
MWSKIIKPVGMIIGGILLGVAMAFLFGWLVMLLWNWLMPPIFGLTTITFWQAWGLVVLAHILFKAGDHAKHHTHHSAPWKNHFREKVKDQLYAQKDDQSEATENV